MWSEGSVEYNKKKYVRGESRLKITDAWGQQLYVKDENPP
jgi:hypothetical protein